MTPWKHKLLVDWAREQRRRGLLRGSDCHELAAGAASATLGFTVDPQLLAAAVARVDAEEKASRRGAALRRPNRRTAPVRIRDAVLASLSEQQPTLRGPKSSIVSDVMAWFLAQPLDVKRSILRSVETAPNASGSIPRTGGPR